MSIVSSRITPCLWFDDQAEEAAALYTGVFPNGKVNAVSRYGEAGREFHGKQPGTAMTVAFELDGQPMTALNGGPMFTFNEAISLQVRCETQEEIDHYWENLSRGGDPAAQRCGWLKDKFGVSWQVTPACLETLMQSTDGAKTNRVMEALFQMQKIEITPLERAFAG